MLCFWPD